ncbi:MAG: hypothetical protein WBP38_14105 [Hyphomicrobium sp.]
MALRSATFSGPSAIFAPTLMLVLTLLLNVTSLMSSPAAAQQGPNGAINPQRDCQTVLTCNYSKKGSYRGCLSSYSCRTCRFVTAKCSIAGSAGKVCRELRCGWGA